MDRTVEVFKSAGGELLALAEKKERQRQAISRKIADTEEFIERKS